MAGLSLHAIQSSAIAITRLNSFGQIDSVHDRVLTLQPRDPLDFRRAESSCPRMGDIELLVEAYLTAERDLVASVDAAGGAVPLPDGRADTVCRAEFDVLPGRQRKRAWITNRRNAPMPPRR